MTQARRGALPRRLTQSSQESLLGLLYASQRRRPVPATLYRVASKEVDAKGLADLALAEVV